MPRTLKGGVVGRCREGRDGGDMLVERSRDKAGDGVAKILDVRSSKGTLLQVDGEAVEAAEVKDMSEMLLVRVQGVGKN